MNLSFCMLALAIACVLSVLSADAGEAQPWSEEAIKARIQKHRTAEVTLTLKDSAGQPLANKPVTISQQRHKFLFGSNAFGLNPADQSDSQKLYQERFTALFNYATLPFYWGAFEATEGQTRSPKLHAMAEWCAKNNLRAKGHPLCWHEVVPPWLAKKPMEEVQTLQVGRVTREAKDFAGLIDNWDVANEFCATPNYQVEKNPIAQLCRKLGQVELLKLVFDAAHTANPKASLVLNDYDTSEKYVKLIKECLDAGLPIDAIGIQSHMHSGYWGSQKAWDACERFAVFGKPLFFTELTIISGDKKENMNWQTYYKDWFTNEAGEKRQMEQVTEFYRMLFSHPAVHGITWWDFSDNNAWLSAPAGLVRKDMSPKPAYEALMKMVKGEWWTAPLKATTDAGGVVKFTVYLGAYKAEAGDTAGTFEVLDAGQSAASANVK